MTVTAVSLSLTDHQFRNLQGVIAGVKEYKLPIQAGYISVAACLAESGMQMYASANVPLSINYPHVPVAWTYDGLGHDHASVGMLQQQVGPSYCKYGGGSGFNQSTVQDDTWGTPAQLMDPKYSIEAFLKRLVGFSWSTVDPWMAAQRVQGSAFPDGRNYRTTYPRAQQLVNAIWTAPTPTPVPAAKDWLDMATQAQILAMPQPPRIIQFVVGAKNTNALYKVLGNYIAWLSPHEWGVTIGANGGVKPYIEHLDNQSPEFFMPILPGTQDLRK